MKAIIDTLIERFSQESTWRGLIAVCTGLGVAIDPQRADAIIAIGMFLIGTINMAKNK